MFLIDNSKKGDIEYYKVSLCELVFWVIRAKLEWFCTNWLYYCEELPQKC